MIIDPVDDGNGTTNTSSTLNKFNKGINTGAPYFVKALSFFSVYAGESSLISLPNMRDPDPLDSIEISVIILDH